MEMLEFLAHDQEHLPTPVLCYMTIYFCSSKMYVNVVKDMFILCVAEVSHNMFSMSTQKKESL